ncbi:MAG: DoxX family protein [Ignavibacteriales bacterium CG12_big_fil_rev_8_21_14_0_65_30_8]|nr:MAG: DoxX family protein [Ignavibacteriales bacterium CG12_big_fil_rev_8_21_14_0_65_30_8]
MKQLTTTVARVIFAIPFLVFGIMHFMKAGDMAGYVPSFIPGGVFWIYLTGLALIAASVSILIQKKAKLACLLLAIMLMIFVLTIHLPGVFNEATRQMSMSSMLKDLALCGAALFFSGSFAD